MIVLLLLFIITLIVYAVFEITFITGNQTFLLKSIISYIRIYKWAKKNIPDTWSFKISFITLTSNQFYIKCIKRDNGDWANDFMSHSWGRVKGEKIIKSMEYYDPDLNKDLLRMKRDSKIKDLIG